MPKHKCLCRCDKKEAGAGGKAVVIDHDRRMPFPKHFREIDSGNRATSQASYHKETAVLEALGDRYIEPSQDLAVETQDALVKIERHRALRYSPANVNSAVIFRYLSVRHLGPGNLSTHANTRNSAEHDKRAYSSDGSKPTSRRKPSARHRTMRSQSPVSHLLGPVIRYAVKLSFPRQLGDSDQRT